MLLDALSEHYFVEVVKTIKFDVKSRDYTDRIRQTTKELF